MVPSLSIACMALSAFAIIVLPIVVAIFIWQNGLTKWWVFLVGMLGFVLTQMVIRIPLMQLFSTKEWFTAFAEHTIPYYLVLAFTAGLFETAGRLLVFLVFIRMRRNYEDGLLAGLGHGTIESILIAGSPAVTNIVYSVFINTNTYYDRFAPYIADNAALKTQLDSVLTELTTSPAVSFLATGLERLIAITLHIALSILVLEGIERKQVWRYALVALGYHMLVDFTVPYVYLLVGNVWLSELLAFVFVIPPIIYIFKAKGRFKDIAAAYPKEEAAI